MLDATHIQLPLGWPKVIQIIILPCEWQCRGQLINKNSEQWTSLLAAPSRSTHERSHRSDIRQSRSDKRSSLACLPKTSSQRRPSHLRRAIPLQSVIHARPSIYCCLIHQASNMIMLTSYAQLGSVCFNRRSRDSSSSRSLSRSARTPPFTDTESGSHRHRRSRSRSHR